MCVDQAQFSRVSSESDVTMLHTQARLSNATQSTTCDFAQGPILNAASPGSATTSKKSWERCTGKVLHLLLESSLDELHAQESYEVNPGLNPTTLSAPVQSPGSQSEHRYYT